MSKDSAIILAVFSFLFGCILAAIAVDHQWKAESIAKGKGEYYIRGENPSNVYWRWKE